jgi:pimeloyl-ACP methyl ester carboxylesterase
MLATLSLVALSALGMTHPPISLTPATSDTLTLSTPTGSLGGTLLMPSGKGPFPLVVFIAGSGPTDRDGNSPLLPGKNNATMMLTEGLANNGIASLRYDKRGVGASRTSLTREDDMRFPMGADDAVAWVNKLRADPRFSTITIAGHSEGSLLGMLAAQHGPIDGYVSIAGAGRAADKVLREQLSKQLPPPMLAEANATLDTLVAGHTVAAPPQALAALFRASVQPYMISWLSVDPQVEIAKLTIPVLIVQGSLDMQVSVSDAQLLAKAQPKAKLDVIDGMNHVFKKVASDMAAQQGSYSDPTIPVAPELIDAVSGFVKSVPRKH